MSEFVLPQHDPGFMAALSFLRGEDRERMPERVDYAKGILAAIDEARAAEGWVPPWMNEETSILVVDGGETCWHGPHDYCPRTDHQSLPLYRVSRRHSK